MTAFPAAFNTWLIDHDDSVAPLPLIGWVHTGGLNVAPLVIGHPGPLVSGEGFLLQNGQVYDPASSTLYDDEGSWREALDNDTLFRPGQPLPHVNPVPATASVASSAAVPARVPSQPKAPVPAGQVEWGTKVYKSKSFWSFTPDGGDEFIFVVEAESPVPKNAIKITREDFYAKRKAGLVERSGRPDDEPELPLEPQVEGSSSDDDDDDLI